MKPPTRIIAVYFVSILLATSWAIAAEPTAIARRDFLDGQNGKLAVFTNAQTKGDAQNSLRFHYFPQNGEYELGRTSSTLWFSVNHIVRSDVSIEPSDNTEDIYVPTYLGVQIISYSKSPYVPSSRLYLFRNANWLGDGGAREGTFARSFADQPLSDFFRLQAPSSSNNDSDTLLQQFRNRFGSWHRRVESTSANSWEFRENWRISTVQNSVADNAAIKNYLIRFTPNPSGYSNRFLLFSTNVSNQSKIRIRTYAPTFAGSPDLFDNDVSITFK